MQLLYTQGMLLNSTLRALMVLSLALCVGACSRSGTGIERDSRVSAQDGGAASCSAESCEGLCCDASCVNSSTDVNNCGECGLVCADNEVCTSAICICIPGTEDCIDPNAEEEEDCETTDSCPCTIGEEQPCYDGPDGTLNVGACSSGTQVCSSAGWSPCVGQVVPAPEGCDANDVDEDCNGLTDDDSDYDADGWTACGGDCCDSEFDDCPEPGWVNPGAYDFINGVDDDCDGEEDNPQPRDCSTGMITSAVTSTNLVEAMDLCTTTTPEERTWGVLSSQLLRANGVGTPDPLQVGVLNAFGSLIQPQENNTLSVLSSGRARGVNDPDFDPWDTSYSSWDTAVGAPADYTTVHSNLQTSSACPSADPIVQDSVLLRIQLRVPTNAQGLEYKFRFFSFEYPVYLCSQYNDFYLAMLTSGHDVIPEDKNISFDAAGNPVTINSAFFTSCEALQCNDPIIHVLQQGPDVNNDGCVDSLVCNTSTQLCESQYGACPDGPDDVRAFTETENSGGGTSWLTTTAPVIPGEIITIEFHIWDTTDSALDSTVLLDAFRWRAEPTGLTTDKQ